jgi:hypothetical protein
MSTGEGRSLILDFATMMVRQVMVFAVPALAELGRS